MYTSALCLTCVKLQVYTSAQGDVSVTDVTTAFKNKYPSVELDDVFGEDSDYDVGRLLAQEFVEKAGITSLPQVMITLACCLAHA